jgi:hypothetical protein
MVKVLYIGGMGRSGSTLLELILSRISGFLPVGELRYVFERGPGENVLCSCGAHFRSCPFWDEVGERAFGGWDKLEVAQVLTLWRSLDRHRHIPRLLYPHGTFAERLAQYLSLLADLYSGIAETSGARVVVDSSKDPTYAFLLRHVRELDLRLLHLVRDPRAVAYAWTKRVRRPEVVAEAQFMRRVSPAKMALLWMDFNLLCHALGATQMPRLRLRYEDFVAAPRQGLDSILALTGEQAEDLPFHDGTRTFEPAPVHTISGNPIRFRSGPIAVLPDEAWKAVFDVRRRRVVTALTWPLLHAYGYGGRVGKSVR